MTEGVHQRLLAEVTQAVAIAASRHPDDYDAALRYLRELLSEEGSFD
jgi:hypothetical protein